MFRLPVRKDKTFSITPSNGAFLFRNKCRRQSGFCFLATRNSRLKGGRRTVPAYSKGGITIRRYDLLHDQVLFLKGSNILCKNV